MSNTANLMLPYLAVGQAQKHVTVNESLRKLDAIVQLSVVSATTTAEPSSPTDGAVYIVPAGKSGTHWSAFADWSLGYHRDGAWVQIAPREGWLAFAKDTGQLLAYTGSAWSRFPAAKILTVSATDKLLGRVSSGPGAAEEVAFTDQAQQLCDDTSFSAMRTTMGAAGLADANIFTATQTFASAYGASMAIRVIEEELILSGPSSTSAIAIPNGSICFGASERVTEAVTGAASFQVGVSGELNKFGDLLGLSLGSTNFGIIGPTAFYSDTPIVVTANGSNFTGGKVRLAIHVLQVTPPQS
ncbi:MAG: DUF2793 domain-containing protein [Hyphomonadaceae bacterium]|nr:DUF2793 domain-containing protein [Hyphomonadaceae bacterium]